jgi:site-specific DNA recombinase
MRWSRLASDGTTAAFFGLQEKRLVRLPKSSKEQDKVAPPLVRLALDIGLRRFDETASATMYLGEINHRRKSFPAEHEPIIEKEVFDAVQNILNENPNRHDTGYNRSDALLGGLLFDDRGNRMSPSHAKKKGVRYNYYVSTPAIQGRKQDSGSVCRVPARAVEDAVTDALRARSGLVKLPDLPDGQSREGLVREVQRIELRADRILVKMRAGDSAGRALDEEEQSDQAHVDPTDDAPIEIPWTPPRSRRRRNIILPVEAKSKPQVKPLRNEERLKLLRAIGTARRWCEALVPVPQAGIEGIAAHHGKTESWVRKHLTLAFLDPKLVEAVVDGLLPRGYGLSRFLDLPADWDGQWRVLGLRDPRNHAPTEKQQ